MATKVTILGEVQPKGCKKKIEFALRIHDGISDTKITEPEWKPSDFKNIELICKGYGSDFYDLMFAYDKHRDEGFIFLGHFNDGIV